MSLASARPVTFVLTRDRAAADIFYAHVLGLAPPVDDGFASVFDLGGATLRITEIADHVASAHPVLGWDVADIAAGIDAMREHGVTMIVYDGMGQDERGIWTSPDGAARIAFFPDPDSNVLCMMERRAV